MASLHSILEGHFVAHACQYQGTGEYPMARCSLHVKGSPVRVFMSAAWQSYRIGRL